MQVRFTKTFLSYEAATVWLHERDYSAVIHFLNPLNHLGPCTVTIEGSDAIRAVEAEAQS